MLQRAPARCDQADRALTRRACWERSVYGPSRQLGEVNVMLAEAVRLTEELKNDFAAFDTRLARWLAGGIGLVAALNGRRSVLTLGALVPVLDLLLHCSADG